MVDGTVDISSLYLICQGGLETNKHICEWANHLAVEGFELGIELNGKLGWLTLPVL